MPVYEVTGPDGRKYEVTAPEGATQAEALAYAQQYHGSATAVAPSPRFAGIPVESKAPRFRGEPVQAPYQSKYTEAQLMPAMRKAYEAGDVAAAKAAAREIRRIREAEGRPGPWTQYQQGEDQAQQDGPWTQYQQQGSASGTFDDLVPSPAPRSDDSIARLEAFKARTYAGSGTDQYGRKGEMPIQDMAPVTARPERGPTGQVGMGMFDDLVPSNRASFAGVSSRADSTAQPAGQPQVDRWRGEKLGVRSAMQGSLGLIGMVGGDSFNEYLVPGHQPLYRDMGATLADKIGLPRPETGSERVINDIGEGLTGTALTMGGGALLNLGKQGVSRLGQFLTANPKLQMVSAATGAGAAAATREGGGGTGAQLVAGLAGGLSPALATSGVAATTRGLTRGRSGDTMRANMDVFRAAGTTPTVGQATEGRTMRGLESLLSRSPGGAGPMAAKANAQNAQMGQAVDNLAGTLAFKSDPSRAGRAIERGVSGPGGFLEKFREKSAQLYDEVDQYLPPNAHVAAAKTSSYLNTQAQPIAGAQNTSAMLANPKLAGIREALETDLSGNNGTIPYEALKQVRSKVGEMISDAGLTSDIPTRQLRQLYGSLSEDMKAAALATGNPKAMAAFNRANFHFRAGMDRMEVIETVVGRNGGPEAVFNAALSGTKEGASKLKAVMQSLPPDAQKQVSATMVRRLGRAVSSQQDDLGEQFSTQTFLTNWNKLSKEAKSTLFGRYGFGFHQDLDKIAKAASNMRDGSAVFANPPGTAGASAQWMSVGGFVLAAGTGQWHLAGGIAAGVGGANVLGKAMANPRFVKWLAKATEAPVGALPAQLTMLRQIAEDTQDETLLRLADQLEREAGQAGVYGQ